MNNELTKVKVLGKWKQTNSSSNKEYWQVKLKLPDGTTKRIRQSRIIATMALGKPLPDKAVVHHISDNSLDDRNQNLVVCEDTAYHMLIHLRTTAYRATGNVHARKCVICKQWGIPGEGDMVLYIRKDQPNRSGQAQHKSCDKERARRARMGELSPAQLNKIYLKIRKHTAEERN